MDGRKREFKSNLIIARDLASDNENLDKGEVEIWIAKPVIEAIHALQAKEDSHERIKYTRYMYEIAMEANSVYTSKIYKFIAMHRKYGGCQITIEELKNKLGVESKYQKFNNFKMRVLEVAQIALYKKSDIWFNYSIIRKGQVPHKINFVIVTPELEKINNAKREKIIYFLRHYFSFTDTHFQKVQHLIDDFSIHQKLELKIVTLYEKKLDGKFKNITQVNNYVLASILAEFTDATNSELNYYPKELNTPRCYKFRTLMYSFR